MRCLTVGMAALLFVGCAHTPTCSPILSGRPISVSELPDAVREAITSGHPHSVPLCASVIELNSRSASHLVKIRERNGDIVLLEVSSEGHIGKEITEQSAAPLPTASAGPSEGAR